MYARSTAEKPTVPELCAVRDDEEVSDLADTLDRSTRRLLPEESGPVSTHPWIYTHPVVPVTTRAEVKRLEALLELIAG